MQTTEPLRVMITGGGTGGHVFPAIAIADAIRGAQPDTRFLFVGAKGKIEMERVPAAGYTIEGLNIAGFQRGLSWSSITRNLALPIKLLRSSSRARRLVREFNPHVVVGTGGYASGPVVRTAQQLGIPTLIQEQNSYAGVTNRILARKASMICVAYEGMETYFPAEKINFTGNPIRADLQHVKKNREAAIQHFGLERKHKTVVIMGGSLGASTLNKAVIKGEAWLNQHPEVQLIWQCGRFYEQVCRESSMGQHPRVQVLPFVERMDLLYAAADLVISRAGALSISELCLVGKPTILIPSPNVAEDHQTKNALTLFNLGAARVVRDVDAHQKMLEETALILDNEALQFGLSEAIRSLGRPQAAETIGNLVIKLAQQQITHARDNEKITQHEK